MKILDFKQLAAIARQNASVTLHASGDEQFEQREVTGEDILAAVEAAGGKVNSIERDDNGVIIAINASGAEPFEYDPHEMGEVLESLQASGPAPSKLVGDLAQTSVGGDIAITGSLTTGSGVITSPSSTTGIAIGNPVSGTGIPSAALITLLSPLTFSPVATATASNVAITVEGEVQVIGLSEWTIDWKRKTVDATTTDGDTYEQSLPSTASWTVKSKYMFIDGDPSQATYVLATIQAPQTPATWNFFPTIAVGRSAWQGQAYVDGITLGSGMGKVVGLDVSLKGTGPLTQLVQLAPVVNTSTVTGQQAED
jgi:hypothetical protein